MEAEGGVCLLISQAQGLYVTFAFWMLQEISNLSRKALGYCVTLSCSQHLMKRKTLRGDRPPERSPRKSSRILLKGKEKRKSVL